MSSDLKNRPLLGKDSNCGILLGILFLFSIISLALYKYIPGLVVLTIFCQATVIFLDAIIIKGQNNGVGPNPIIYPILTLILWVIFVPLYILDRKNYSNSDSQLKKVTEISTSGLGSGRATIRWGEKALSPDTRRPDIDSSKNESTSITDEKIPSKVAVVTWAGNSKEIQIKNYLIPNPLLYWAAFQVGNNEASCINLNLPIGNPVDEPKGAMGYWPRYSSISSDQRANYLEWLSSGRSTELSDIGYAFLFFYGLEYRALRENTDISVIIPEVNVLLKNYTTSNSFNSYLSSFLAYIAAQQLSFISENNFSQYFPNLLTLSYDQVLVALSWHINQNKAIPWELAYSLANTIPEAPKSVITHKLPIQFKQLFETKFISKFPGGFKIEPSVRKYKIEYRPASPSLLYNYQSNSKGTRIEPVEIINPLGKKSQFNKIFSIWVETIEELKPASRKINKGDPALTSQAYHALPDSLKQEIDHPEKSKWDQVIAEFNSEDDLIIVPINSLAALIPIEKRERLTPTQSKLLYITARDVGYVLIPDHRITGIPYQWDDSVALFPLPDKRTFTSDTYPAVAFILELGMSIALADEKFSPVEQEHLDKVIFGSFELTSLDVACLKQYQQILIRNPPSLERLGTRLKEHLSDDKKMIVAGYLRDLAFADGILDQSEYNALNKIFKAMGLGKNDIQVLFPSDLTSQPDEQPIQISRSSSVRTGEPIIKLISNKPFFTLDPDLLREKFIDTREIQKILSDVIIPEDEELLDYSEEHGAVSKAKKSIESESPIIQEESTEINYIGLHPKYSIFLKGILSQTELSKTEMQKYSRNNGFMLDAAVEDINTWSEENYGDILFESTEENLILVNSEIKNKIEEGAN